MAKHPIWITEAEVVSLIDLPGAMDALEKVLALEAEDAAENLPKTHLMVGDNDAMHAIGAAIAGAGLCGTKTWVNVGGKSSTVVILFSLEDGACEAVIEATALGQMRTGAMTGVGTRWLAPAGADEMAVIGSGKQALTQVAACLAAKDITRIRVHSRSPDKRAAFADAVRSQLDVEVTDAETVADAVRDAPVITLITNATEPFLMDSMVAPGAHINAMGAIVPKRVEFEPSILARCDVVAVDSIDSIRNLSREFIDHYDDGPGSWDDVIPISRLIADGYRRPADAGVTLFKAMGMGMSDLALGIEILARARAKNAGHPLPERVRTPPRLRAEG